jgi:hypothetical protein
MAVRISLISPEEAAKYASKAREYGPPEAPRLNIAAIVFHFRVKEMTFRKRQQVGWPSLGGRRLLPQPMPCPGVPFGKEDTFLRADVDQALAPELKLLKNGPTANGRFHLDGKWRLTRERAAKEVCMSVDTLSAMDAECDYLDKESLVPTTHRNPETGGIGKFYDEGVIERLKAKMSEVRDGRWLDKDGRPWFSRARALRELTFGRKRLSRMTPRSWMNKKYGCKHLGRRPIETQKLRFKRNPFDLHSPAGEWVWYLEADVLAIKRAILSKTAAHKTEGSQPSAERRPKPIQRFSGLFEDGSDTVAWTAREIRLSKGRLWSWLRNGFPKDLELHAHFPGELPHKRKLVPGSQGHWVETISQSDREKLRGALQEAMHATRVRKGEMSVAEILAHYKVQGHFRRFLVGLLLQLLRESGQLPCRRVLRQCGSKRKWVFPYLYNLRDMERCLGGRSIVEVATENWESLRQVADDVEHKEPPSSAPSPPVALSDPTRESPPSAKSTDHPSPASHQVLPFIPTAFQRRILEALGGKALTATKLQMAIGCDRKTLYKRGLKGPKGLMAHGKVVNIRSAGGYFRPDAPPAKIAEFIGGNRDFETVLPTNKNSSAN